MKMLGRLYYVILVVVVGGVSAVVLADSVRSRELDFILRDWPMILAFLVCVGAAIGLAFFYFSRRGAVPDENQVGCVIYIALAVVALVAVLILIALGAIFNFPGS